MIPDEPSIMNTTISRSVMSSKIPKGKGLERKRKLLSEVDNLANRAAHNTSQQNFPQHQLMDNSEYQNLGDQSMISISH